MPEGDVLGDIYGGVSSMYRWMRKSRHVESGPPEFATPNNYKNRSVQNLIDTRLKVLLIRSGQPLGGLERWKKRANSSRLIGRGRI